MPDSFHTDLDKVPANFQALSPIDFLTRAAEVYGHRDAVAHGDQRTTYRELDIRCRRLASALNKRGIGKGSVVSVIAPNIPAHLECHFGVPMSGAVLNAINIRLDAGAIAFILDHGECDLLLVDADFADVAREAVAQSSRKPTIVDIDDALGPQGVRIGETTYEALLENGDPNHHPNPVDDEWRSLALNYTSGTTGNPKGVVYHYRGAYLNAIGNALAWNMTQFPTYLWTLPMFHCNGWCFPWAVTMHAGLHVCLRTVAPEDVIPAIVDYQVTHMCGAPIVLNMIANAPDELRSKIPSGLKVMTAGAAPPPAVIQAMEDLGATVTHVYGLTEVYGPCVVCAPQTEWDGLSTEDRVKVKARQGVRYSVLENLDVLDPETMKPVPADGETIGEIMFRGNVVMKGYLKNPKATTESFDDGWFHSGDLAVKHPDNYVEIRDRSKDIIISGGENISSIEVEGVLYKHPDVLNAAVVARPDEKWGETPCAFVEVKPGSSVTEADLIAYCRDNMAHFKAPKTIVFQELPKTSTGKIQKFVLRSTAKDL
ncbi:MAG: acyl-CoA synthetase [Pseudomonadota bacterium]